MHLVDLYPEIRLEIAHFCSPGDLAALSRVHTSLRDVADRVLYGHIHFLARTLDLVQDQESDLPWALKESLSPLHTLLTNSQKAAMVRSLCVELLAKPMCIGIKEYNSFLRLMENTFHSVMVRISHSLKKLPKLVDLRIICGKWDDPSNGQISQVIRGNHFQLHTLWLEHGHDLAGIIADQPSLRFLGIYCDRIEIGFWKKIRGLFQNPMPAICILHTFTSRTSQLEIFPASHRSGEVLQECREIARSLREFPTCYYPRRKCYLKFNLFGITNENINLLTEVTKGVATCFPYMRFTGLEITIDDIAIKPWRIPEFIDALPLLGVIQDVNFNFPSINDPQLEQFLTDVHDCLVKELGKAWPKIKRVRVRHGYLVEVLRRSSDWSLTANGHPDSDSDVVRDEEGDIIYNIYQL